MVKTLRLGSSRRGQGGAALAFRSTAKRSSQPKALVAASLLLLLLAVLEAKRPRRPAWEPKLAPEASLFLVPQPDNFYRVAWGGLELPAGLRAGATVQALLTVRNGSRFAWPDAQMADPRVRGGGGSVRVSHRWWSAENGALIRDYEGRTSLPWPLRPGESVTLPVSIRLPASAGTYRLQIDLVQELVTWFETRGAERLLVPVRIEAHG